MKKNKSILMVLAFLPAIILNCHARNGDSVVNISDSISVNKFIVKSNVCERLAYVQSNAILFTSGDGFGKNILESITKESGKPLFLMYSNSGIVESEEEKLRSLKSQILEIQESLHCEKYY